MTIDNLWLLIILSVLYTCRCLIWSLAYIISIWRGGIFEGFICRMIFVRKFWGALSGYRNGRRIYRAFLSSDFVLQDTINIFASVFKITLRYLWLKFFIFKWAKGKFCGTSKGVYLPPINPEVFFQANWPRQVD